MIIITTKISRSEMIIAKRMSPKYKKHLSKAAKQQAATVLASIIERMQRLVVSMCKRAYGRFQHSTDRAMGLEDLIAMVNAGLVLGVYRYKRNGKYEPYNYLMGVINIVLRNAHNWRNRKKRIPAVLMSSIDAGLTWNGGREITLQDNISSPSRTISPVSRSDIRWRKKKKKDEIGGKDDIRIVPLHISRPTAPQAIEDTPAVMSDMEAFSRFDMEIEKVKIGTIDSHEILRMLVHGHPVRVIAEAAGVGRTSMRKFIKKAITEPLMSAVI